MDLEEQRLRHHIEVREISLKKKINMLKERLEHFKRIVDVKSKVQQRPGPMFIGSIVAGFLAKKIVGGKNRHSPYHPDSRPVPLSTTAGGHFLDPTIAIISAIATRATIGIISEIFRKVVPPRKPDRWQSDQNVRNN